ncbi:hypothetical protein OG21DRAFT_447035 [Imleria badia]|nr:hypothetical protein OG21DRAFT_447035 [Imleria badia]
MAQSPLQVGISLWPQTRATPCHGIHSKRMYHQLANHTRLGPCEPMATDQCCLSNASGHGEGQEPCGLVPTWECVGMPTRSLENPKGSSSARMARGSTPLWTWAPSQTPTSVAATCPASNQPNLWSLRDMKSPYSPPTITHSANNPIRGHQRSPGVPVAP